MCNWRAGLTMHKKQMYRVFEERVKFVCEWCSSVLQTAEAKENNRGSCTGEIRMVNGRECKQCVPWVVKGNYARHLRGCGARRYDNVEVKVEIGEKNV